MNKRYYWLKLKEDFFEEETIQWLEEQEQGYIYSNFYLKLCLKSINNRGVLIRQVGDILVPYDAKKLAEMTRTDINTVIVALELLKKIGLIEILDNGELFLKQVSSMVGSETESTRRSRKSREKKKELENKQQAETKLLQCNKNSNSFATPEIRDKDIRDKDIRDKDIRDRDIETVEQSTTTTTSFVDICKKYKREISRNSLDCSPKEIDMIKKLISSYGADKVANAIDIAVVRNKKSLGYIRGILKADNTNRSSPKDKALPEEYNIDF